MSVQQAIAGIAENIAAKNRQLVSLKAEVNELNALLRGVGWGQGEIDSSATFAEDYERLQRAVRKMSYRECWDCGHVAYYLDGFTPHCLCEKCNSQDTRLIREAARAKEE